MKLKFFLSTLCLLIISFLPRKYSVTSYLVSRKVSVIKYLYRGFPRYEYLVNSTATVTATAGLTTHNLFLSPTFSLALSSMSTFSGESVAFETFPLN